MLIAKSSPPSIYDDNSVFYCEFAQRRVAVYEDIGEHK
jgi:hypothetical protein